MSGKAPNLVRTYVAVAVLSGVLWGPPFALWTGNPLDGSLFVASALFGLFVGITGYMGARRTAKTQGAEALQLHCQRTLAVAAPPASVFEALREHLEGSDTYELRDASAEFFDLRARRKGSGLLAGEDVTIHLAAQGEGTAIRVDSHTASPQQQLDQGRNLRNVEELAGLLIDGFSVDAELEQQERRVQQAAARRVPEG